MLFRSLYACIVKIQTQFIQGPITRHINIFLALYVAVYTCMCMYVHRKYLIVEHNQAQAGYHNHIARLTTQVTARHTQVYSSQTNIQAKPGTHKKAYKGTNSQEQSHTISQCSIARYKQANTGRKSG